MKLKKFNDGYLTLTFSVEEFKCFAEFLRASTSVLADYRKGVLEIDIDGFKSTLDVFDSLSVGNSFEIRHFFVDLANVL